MSIHFRAAICDFQHIPIIHSAPSVQIKNLKLKINLKKFLAQKTKI